MPNSADRLLDIQENDSRVTSAVQNIGYMLGTSAQLMPAIVPTSATMLEVWEKTVGFGKLVQSLEEDYLSYLVERAFRMQINVANS